MNVHGSPECALDTIDSIRKYATGDVLVVVEGSSWPTFRDLDMPASKMEGFRHAAPKSPYRNVALALKSVTENWDADWYCYCEADVLFGSDRFMRNLEMADDMGVWMLGNDGHVDSQAMPLVSAMLGEAVNNSYYLLGCCQFFSRKFTDRLNGMNFFDRFLSMTGGFTGGDFPFYGGYDISEHMYPSLCRHFGGNVGVFATWDGVGKEWHGAAEHFPMRWRPEIGEGDPYRDASIIHPAKDAGGAVRLHHREKRRG